MTVGDGGGRDRGGRDSGERAGLGAGGAGAAANAGPGGASGAAPEQECALLLVSRRGALTEDVLRIAAAAGQHVEVAPDLVAAARSWGPAALVLVDDAVLAADPHARMPRRPEVVVLGETTDDADVWRRAVVVGAEHVVFLPDGAAWLVERIADLREGARRPARVVAVVGGRGGAGATTLAAALAVTAVARGSETLLVDLDPLGGGIDLALGVEGASGLRWPDLASARGRINGPSLRDALPRAGQLPVLSWDRGSDVEVPFDAAHAVLAAAMRSCDVVVVDLPRWNGRAADHAVSCADELLVVVPAEVRAVASAERVLRAYRPLARGLRAVVRVPGPAGLSSSAVGAALALDVAGELRPEPRLAQSLDRGEPPGLRGRGPLAQLCGALLEVAVP